MNTYYFNVLENRSYSVADLERATGFDRRTIVYYMQIGLLARPGRHGPKTRYPAEAMTRLQFVRGVKDLQARGALLNFTLLDIRRAMERAGIERIEELLERRMPVAEIAPLLAPEENVPAREAAPVARPAAIAEPLPATPVTKTEPPPTSPALPSRERRAFGLADANVRQRFASSSQTGPAPLTDVQPLPTAPGSEPAQLQSGVAAQATAPADMAELGRLLRELEIRPAMSGRRLPPGASEQWTEIPITSRVFLSVRGLGAEDAPLADAVARTLKKVLRAG